MLKKVTENRNNRIMLVILIIGIVIIIISSAIPDESTNTEQSINPNYREEERLGEILSEIEGVGCVSVMISYISTAEKDIVTDDESGRIITSGGDVVVKREVYPNVRGVVVTADGAVDPKIKKIIAEAVMAVTGVGANRVCVFPRER